MNVLAIAKSALNSFTTHSHEARPRERRESQRPGGRDDRPSLGFEKMVEHLASELARSAGYEVWSVLSGFHVSTLSLSVNFKIIIAIPAIGCPWFRSCGENY